MSARGHRRRCPCAARRRTISMGVVLWATVVPERLYAILVCYFLIMNPCVPTTPTSTVLADFRANDWTEIQDLRPRFPDDSLPPGFIDLLSHHAYHCTTP